MRAQIGCHQEEWHARIAPPQKINTSVGDPVGGMVFLFVRPRAGNPAVAVQSCVRHICIGSEFLFQPVKIIICHKLGLAVGNASVPGTMEISVVELYIVKTEIIAKRMYMHLSHTLGIVSGF